MDLQEVQKPTTNPGEQEAASSNLTKQTAVELPVAHSEAEGQTGQAAEVVEALSGMRVRMPKITTAQRRRLKRLREQGVDTSKIRVEPRAAATTTSTPGQAVKRSVSARKTPDEKVVKKPKEVGTTSYASVTSGIRAVVVLATYPEGRMAQEDAGKVHLLVEKAIDSLEDEPGPRFEASRWLGEYLGYICANEASLLFLRKAAEATGEFRVFLPKELPPRIKVMVQLPKQEAEATVFRRLEKQNGVCCKRWKILRSKVDEKGYQMILAIDEHSRNILQSFDWKLYYTSFRVQFRLLEEKGKAAQEEKMEVAEGCKPDGGSASSASQPST